MSLVGGTGEAPVQERRGRGLGGARDGMDTGPKILHRLTHVPGESFRPWVAVAEAWCRVRGGRHTHRGGRRQGLWGAGS